MILEPPKINSVTVSTVSPSICSLKLGQSLLLSHIRSLVAEMLRLVQIRAASSPPQVCARQPRVGEAEGVGGYLLTIPVLALVPSPTTFQKSLIYCGCWYLSSEALM